MFRQYKLRDFRLRLVILVYAISILSVFVVGSAAEEYQNQQIMGIVIGSAAMLVLTFMDYRILLNFAWVIYTGNLVLLLLVDLIGQESNGAKRWLKLGFLRFQPSELTKLALIVFFAYFFYEIQGKAEQFSGHSGITYIAWNSACTGIITAASVSNYHDYVHFLCVDFCRRSEL